jgi:hypothetical protein
MARWIDAKYRYVAASCTPEPHVSPIYHRPSVCCWLELAAGSGGSAESSLALSNEETNRHLLMSLSPPQREDEA